MLPRTLHPISDLPALGLAVVQSTLGSPPKNIFCRKRPFLATQIAQFGLEQAGRDFLAEIGAASGITQQLNK
jgi:hypothetical protein